MKVRSFIVSIYMLALLAGCVSSGGTRIDNIPMYGQPEIQRQEYLKEGDEEFIKKAASIDGGRERASQIWWREGERYMNEGNFDYAMRRYNQSWLLDPENYQPYWGFGRVTLQQGKVDKAIGFLEKAIQLINDPYEKVSLLADIGSAYTIKAEELTIPQERQETFEVANGYFEESTQLDPNYSGSWRRWAFSLYEQHDYPEAWAKIKKARALNAKPFPQSFISALEREMLEPQ